MSDVLESIKNQEDRYLFLCSYFNEPEEYIIHRDGYKLLDCFGKHCEKLEKKLEREQKNENRKTK